MRRMPTFSLLVALLFLAAACGGDEEGGTTTIDGRSANDHGSEDVSGEDSIEFELDDFYFEPTIFEGEPAQQITLEAFNEGEAAHTFTSEERVDEVLQPGDERDVTRHVPRLRGRGLHLPLPPRPGMIGAIEVR